MKRCRQLGNIVFSYNSLFLDEEFSPKSKVTEVYLSAANTRITYSADLQNPPCTLNSKEYGYLTDEQRIAIIEEYNNDSELVAQFTDDTMEILKFSLESPPTFQEIFEGACLYTAIIPMYYVHPQPNSYFVLNAVITNSDPLFVGLEVQDNTKSEAITDDGQYLVAEDGYESKQFLLAIGTHTITFTNADNIVWIETTHMDGAIPQMPVSMEGLSSIDGTITGYSGDYRSSCTYIALSNNAINIAELNSLLAKIDDAGGLDGFAILTGNSIPTNQTAIDSLIAKGWYVEVDV